MCTCMRNWVTLLYSRKNNCIGEIIIKKKKSNCSGLGCFGGGDSIPSPVQWVKGLGLVAPAAQIKSLAWELSYAMGVAIKQINKIKMSRGVT